MSGFEVLKKYREQSGFTVRNFAKEVGISPRSVSYYENGKISLITLPVFKAISIYDILDINIEEFYDEYYLYKEDIDLKISEWKKENPRELNYDVLKHRIMGRLAKIKERENVSKQSLEQLYEMFHDVCEKGKLNQDEKGYISSDFYEEFIMKLLYAIKKSLYSKNLEAGNYVNTHILDALMKKEYTALSVSEFCNISPKYFSNYINGTYDFSKMQIITALKLCYVLDLDFNETFRMKN